MQQQKFDYQPKPFDIREVITRADEGVCVRDFTYESQHFGRWAAYYVYPEAGEDFAAILNVHWYEPEALDSNRTQFLNETKTIAQQGAASLLVETLWSDRDWFIKRTQDDDYDDSIRQVNELRRAMNLLLAQPGVDPKRFAYVGHDFGAMYGVVMGSIDPRPTCYVFMAATPKFSDWFLYYPQLEGEERTAYIDHMNELDPVSHIANLAPAPVLFQFADKDFHVPEDRALAFYNAAEQPKEIRWYQAGHGLNDTARQERIAWLREQLEFATNHLSEY